MSSRKTYRFRLYPNRQQQEKLVATLDVCRELYNAALQERRESYRTTGKGTTFVSQSAQLPAIKEIRDDVNGVYSQVLQDVLHRLDKTYQSFFQRVQRHQKAGFPRFKGRDRYDSFTYPQLGFSLTGNRLQLSKIGNIKVKLHREMKGSVKTLTLRRDAGCWYACFSVEFEPAPLPRNDKATGIDVGLSAFATLSDGTEIANPRLYQAAQAKFRRAQRRVARRRNKKSKGRRRAILLLQKAHRRVCNQRSDFQHKLSHQIVRDFGIIAIEDLNVKGLASGMLAKSVHDVGWSSFIAKLSYKAANAGRTLIAIDPRGTSQTCLCGATVRKLLSNREHVCTECGLIAPRDVVSAQVILQRALGLSVDALTECSNAA